MTEIAQLSLNPLEIGCRLRDGSIGSVIYLRIKKSPKVHSIVGDGTFKRVGASNQQLTAAEINELSFQRGIISAENNLEDIDFELLDTEYWHAFAQQRKLTRPIAEAMFHLGLAKRDNNVLKPIRAAVPLFAEEPSGLLGGKAAIRLFHYQDKRIEHGSNPNLVRKPKTISGPLISQINVATDAIVNELASGIQMGPLGFEIVHSYPLRVLREAITNAVIHRDYRLNQDIHIRIFSDRIEIDSPGLFVGPVKTTNIGTIGTYARNPMLVNQLREFPTPPNLDAGEGVRMMIHTMRESGLYPPLYQSLTHIGSEVITIRLLNQHRPSAWEQVDAFLNKHSYIQNADVKKILDRQDTLAASKQLRDWVDRGLLVIANPQSGKRSRKYSKPDFEPEERLLSFVAGKQPE